MKSSKQSVSLAMRVHPFPSRTRQLSSSVLKILGWKRPGKIRRCRHKNKTALAHLKRLKCLKALSVELRLLTGSRFCARSARWSKTASRKKQGVSRALQAKWDDYVFDRHVSQVRVLFGAPRPNNPNLFFCQNRFGLLLFIWYLYRIITVDIFWVTL